MTHNFTGTNSNTSKFFLFKKLKLAQNTQVKIYFQSSSDEFMHDSTALIIYSHYHLGIEEIKVTF